MSFYSFNVFALLKEYLDVEGQISTAVSKCKFRHEKNAKKETKQETNMLAGAVASET